jgi:hypothetical protein
VGSTLCFECHRAGRARDQSLRRAATLDTASEARFQTLLPFAPVNRARLERLRAARADSRRARDTVIGRLADRRRRAQMAARQALERIAATMATRNLAAADRVARERQFAAAVHAAELQLPDSWLPFVVSY